VEGTVEYLSKQIVAGAEVVKLFDSWAGSLKGADFDKVCIEPNQRIVEALRSKHPDTPIIGFPRGAGDRSVDFAKATGVNCIAIDQSMNAEWARDNLQSICAVQGNLDPTLMVGTGDALEKHVEKLINTLGDGPYIFNLGHGITPDADPNNVSKLIELVRK
jgi:uroporphyrinogen decarboxylase